MTRKTCVVVAGLVLAGLMACETGPKQSANPGALPKSDAGLSPRLSASTYVAHGELLERRGDFERAAQQYRQALELRPDLPAAQNRLGITLNKLGRHSEASAEFRAALARHPDEPYLYNNLGFSLYLEKEYDEAEPVLARAAELQPSFRRARMNHGLVLARLGRYEQARVEFSQAGSEGDAHYNVAVIQSEAGQYALAARSLEQALKCDPTLDAARDQLRQISRLAAAQEAAAVAAAEAEAARVAAVAEAKRVADAAAEAARRAAAQAEAAAQASSAIGPDVGLAADVQTIEEGHSSSAAPLLPDPERVNRVYERIATLLAVRDRPFSTATVWWTPTLEAADLRDMLNDLIYGAVIDAPWYATRVTHYEELLGLTGDVR